MGKTINIIRRLGNKETDIKFFKHLLPLDAKTVVEPFGGTFAVIKHFYKDITKYKFHINDNDETLYYVYKNYSDAMKQYEELCKVYASEYKEDLRRLDFKKYFMDLDMNKHIHDYIIKNIFVKGNMFKDIKNFDNFNPIEKDILDNALITNLDYTEVFQTYKDDADAFLFLDPPYLFSDNSNYASQVIETDMTQIIVDILHFIKCCKCKVMLIINRLNLLEYLFKDYIKGEYMRIYQISKKKSIHLIITNYDIDIDSILPV